MYSRSIGANRAATQAGHARTRGMDLDIAVEPNELLARVLPTLLEHISGDEKLRMTLDEYPPAMFREGGLGASVRPMTPAQNRGMGSCIGNQCRGVPDGSQVQIIVID